jgi:hypothetical protein
MRSSKAVALGDVAAPLCNGQRLRNTTNVRYNIDKQMQAQAGVGILQESSDGHAVLKLHN